MKLRLGTKRKSLLVTHSSGKRLHGQPDRKRHGRKFVLRKMEECTALPYYERKALYFAGCNTYSDRKEWYKRNCKLMLFRHRVRKVIRFLVSLRIRSKILDTVRWVIVDFLRAKPKKFWGIYAYVALPGEGKTLSMVAHMERARTELGKNKLFIATNFNYRNQDMAIGHWIDIIKASKLALRSGKHCIIAIDEIHTTFDRSDWKNFPPAMLSLLSFNRKYGMQFICSSQIYDRIPKKIVDITNYVVLCKNTLGLDRHFKNYYYNTNDYEAKFSGKRSRADFLRTFVASDELYGLYDTLAQVDQMTAEAEKEKQLKQQAFDLLFGGESSDDAAD